MSLPLRVANLFPGDRCRRSPADVAVEEDDDGAGEGVGAVVGVAEELCAAAGGPCAVAASDDVVVDEIKKYRETLALPGAVCELCFGAASAGCTRVCHPANS